MADVLLRSKSGGERPVWKLLKGSREEILVWIRVLAGEVLTHIDNLSWIHFDARLADGFKVGCEEQTVIIARLTPADPRERHRERH